MSQCDDSDRFASAFTVCLLAVVAVLALTWAACVEVWW